MEGATHFIEQYVWKGWNLHTTLAPISELNEHLLSTIENGAITIAIFLIKPKPTNEQ